MANARDTFYRTGAKDEPATRAYVPTKHDTNDITTVSRGIYVGGSGDVKVKTIGGDTVTFVGVPAGTVLPVRAKQVFNTGTTATSLLVLY